MDGAPVDGRGTYVLDTSVLLSDPMAFSRFGRHDGVLTVVNDLQGHPLFAHMSLTRSERSPVAGLVTGLLETEPLSLG